MEEGLVGEGLKLRGDGMMVSIGEGREAGEG